MSTHTFQQDRRHPGYCRVEGCQLPPATECHNVLVHRCDQCGSRLDADETGSCSDCKNQNQREVEQAELEHELYGLRVPENLKNLR